MVLWKGKFMTIYEENFISFFSGQSSEKETDTSAELQNTSANSTQEDCSKGSVCFIYLMKP